MENIEQDDCVFMKAESTEVADNMENGRIFGLIPVFVLILIMFIRIVFVLYKSKGQKTRSTQQRRAYMGQRQRPSDTQEPTIYVSPANLPPPPKYEAMAPPSYEEVVGIHYPNYQPQIQPIAQPITTALAQSSNPVNSVSGNGNHIAASNSNAVSGNSNDSSASNNDAVSSNSNAVSSGSTAVSGNGNGVNGSSSVVSGNSQVSPSTVITVTADDKTTVTVTSS